MGSNNIFFKKFLFNGSKIGEILRLFRPIIFFLCSQSFGQKVSVVTKKGEAIPNSTIYVNGNYGMIADERGQFVSSNLSQDDTLMVTSLGFKKRVVIVKNLLNDTLQLEESSTLLPQLTARNKKTAVLGYTGQKQTIHSSNLITSIFYETGIVIKNTNHIIGILKSVRVKVGFIGHPKLSYRINIYTITNNNLPSENLMKREIVFIPESKKLKWYKFDISDQQIELPEGGICIGPEIINPSAKTFTKDFTPARLGFFSQEFLGVYRSDKSNGWQFSKASILAAGIEIMPH